jgi:hypothetical protein
MITELAKGKSIEEAVKISRNDVADALEGLPPIKMHCSNLAADALKALDGFKMPAGKWADYQKQGWQVESYLVAPNPEGNAHGLYVVLAQRPGGMPRPRSEGPSPGPDGGGPGGQDQIRYRSLIYLPGNFKRYIPIKFAVASKDLGGTVEMAQEAVEKVKKYREWLGAGKPDE